MKHATKLGQGHVFRKVGVNDTGHDDYGRHPKYHPAHWELDRRDGRGGLDERRRRPR